MGNVSAKVREILSAFRGEGEGAKLKKTYFFNYLQNLLNIIE